MTNERRKYREFWIGQSISGWTAVESFKAYEFLSPNPEKAIHVIEFSAFSECQAEVERLKAELNCPAVLDKDFLATIDAVTGYQDKITKLTAEIAAHKNPQSSIGGTFLSSVQNENEKLKAELSLTRKERDEMREALERIKTARVAWELCDDYETQAKEFYGHIETLRYIADKALQHARKDRGE